MTDAPTLGEVEASMAYAGMPTAYSEGLHRSLYGIEVTCPECGGAAVIGGDLAEQDPCPRCNGTGKVREGGLVERVVARFDDLLPPDEERLREALRQEIGEP